MEGRQGVPASLALPGGGQRHPLPETPPCRKLEPEGGPLSPSVGVGAGGWGIEECTHRPLALYAAPPQMYLAYSISFLVTQGLLKT